MTVVKEEVFILTGPQKQVSHTLRRAPWGEQQVEGIRGRRSHEHKPLSWLLGEGMGKTEVV